MDWEGKPSVATPVSADNLNQAQQDAIDAAIAAGGVELSGGYAERTSNYQRTGAGTDDVTGVTITISADGVTPIYLEAQASAFYNSGASGIATVAIQEGATVITAATNSLSADLMPLCRGRRFIPSAGSHTYKLTIGQLITGNATIAGAANSPIHLRATRAD